MCCECSAGLFKRKQRCGECEACLRTDACGQCAACKTKVRFGGTVKIGGRQCERRRCKQMRYAAPEGSSTTLDGKQAGSKFEKGKSKRRPVSKSVVKVGLAPESHFLTSPFHSYSKLRPDDGLNSDEIKVICLKPTNKVSFFSQLFRNRVLRVEKSLRDIPPEKIATDVSIDYINDAFSPISLTRAAISHVACLVRRTVFSRLCKGEQREEWRWMQMAALLFGKED